VLRVSVDSLIVEPTGNGYTGSLGRLTVSYPRDSATPATLIAKLPSTDSQIRRYAIDDGMYRRETRFYQELAADSSISVPDCYHAEFDNDSGEFVLLLEDLVGLEEGDELAGCSLEQAANVVQSLARLHAARWNDHRVSTLQWLVGPDSPSSTATGLQNIYVDAWQKTSNTLAEIYPAETYKIADRLGPGLASVLRTAETGNQALNHGDAHLGNTFFRGDEAVFVDWQNVMVTSPALDIAYFVQGSLPVETRRANERDLLDIYMDTLAENGVTGYRQDQLIQDYRRGLLRTLIPSVLSMANLDMTAPESRDLVETIGARMIGIADWDCGALIPAS